ncbi:hypothetical protein, conserved [Babesia bigemina]|uniref:Uncharacterized protein n=1 Tax=Babesia bigemina TaxID=5866 RepID=A0A061D4J5_BABBI|nr:hypothetical protein, conserved [Babesia bigemina]CDR93859.1 hypothetical protein, conserved [Babesia bigemina]|eukprot:XP_012766045.1 hypothetical protein, conserved [Babesia bigemina]
MSLLCRIDDGRPLSGCHAISRRSIAAASEDNQVVIMHFNHAYVVQTRRQYAEVVSKIPSDARLDVKLATRNASKGALKPMDSTPEELRKEQASHPSTRFVAFAWTPAAIPVDGRLTSALCTVTINERFEMWLPKSTHSEEMYEVEKICDLSEAVASHLTNIAPRLHNKKAPANDHHSSALLHAGVSMCHFAPQHTVHGFAGLVGIGRHLVALWISTLPVEQTDDCSDDGSNGSVYSDGGPQYEAADENAEEAAESKIVRIIADSHVFNQQPDDLKRFDMVNIKCLFPTPISKTTKRRVGCHAIATMESGHVCSMAIAVNAVERHRLVYDVFVGTGDGHIRTIELRIPLDGDRIPQASAGPWRNLVAFPHPPEMLRVRVFHGNDADARLLIALVHNMAVVYNLEDGTHQRHRCGGHPLVSYHTEPLFMRGGDLASMVFLDAMGTRYFFALSADMRMRATGITPASRNDPVTVFLDETDVAHLQVAIDRPALQIRRSLRSPNLVATALDILMSGGNLLHMAALVQHHVHRREMPTTDSMFTLKNRKGDFTLDSVTMQQFLQVASTSPVLQLWREFHDLLQHPQKQRVATLLYLIAYAEAGGDASHRTAEVSLRERCRPLVRRLTRGLTLTNEGVAGLQGLAECLYTRKQLQKLINTN